MKRLEKTDLIYLHILYVIWQLVDYYSALFKVDAGQDPAKIPTEIRVKDGITYLRFSFPKILNEQTKYPVLQMRDIYNDYLRINLLPAQNVIRPFSNGSAVYDIVEALFVDSVFENESDLFLEVVYVDNSLAFHYVRNKEKEIQI